jgi:hypothetical protein
LSPGSLCTDGRSGREGTGRGVTWEGTEAALAVR